jgi:hypothetical protein
MRLRTKIGLSFAALILVAAGIGLLGLFAGSEQGVLLEAMYAGNLMPLNDLSTARVANGSHTSGPSSPPGRSTRRAPPRSST